LKNKSLTGFKISSGAYSVVNKELPLSWILIGGQLSHLSEFCETAQIYHTESNYDTLQSQLCEVVDNLFKQEQKTLLEKLNRKTRRMPVKIQVDEQHSRSQQRNGSAAPYASAVFITKVDGIDKIIHLSHASSMEAMEQQIKCKAKACRNLGLEFLAKNLKSSQSILLLWMDVVLWNKVNQRYCSPSSSKRQNSTRSLAQRKKHGQRVE
jgi:hypothetical protein